MKVLKERLITVCKSFFRIPSKQDLLFSTTVICIYALCALLFGFMTKLFQFSLFKGDLKTLIALPFILMFIPSIPEELFFRGILLPHRQEKSSPLIKKIWIVSSILLFVLWHPFAALTTYTNVQELFTDIRFITIVTMLAIACTITYLKIHSIWIPIFIHWLTVLVWMLFLGGRNFALDMM